jgi:hypothetical protein
MTSADVMVERPPSLDVSGEQACTGSQRDHRFHAAGRRG